MKNNYAFILIFVLTFSIPLFSFSQNDCGANAGFESGNTNGWICKWGTYGALSGICPDTVSFGCPSFPTTLDSTGSLNLNGNDALGTTGVDRHTIMTKNYRPWAGGGKGMDSLSNNAVPVVNPYGGNYSFRLGDAIAGGFGTNPNRFARAEAIRIKFTVQPATPFFCFSYAVFLQDPGHLPEEQPRFEVLFKDDKDSLLPGGYFKFVIGSNPYCIGILDSSIYKFGIAPWRYTNWRDTCFDLNGYSLQNISVEFRTSDCFPQQAVTSGCTPCCHAPGTHSAYAYIEASCMPTAVIIKEKGSENNIRIYPNPINSSSILELSSPLTDAEIIIYDVLGKEMMRKKFSGMKTEIRKEDLEAGVYFVKVRSKEKQLTQKIIVQ